MTPLFQILQFQQAIIEWFRREGRDYPWRRTSDPYAVLVSEMMLQQTQVATVLGRGYYENWLRLFPTVEALAAASEPELLRAWEGLGYYNRARNLQKAARVVCQEFGGRFPTDAQALERLPGLGKYTAGAVATFAFDLPAPIVDANILRVLARLFDFRQPVDSNPGRDQIWAWAGQLVPASGPRQYNSGLMEIGQRICSPKRPACHLCPIHNWCAGSAKDPSSLPIKRPKRQTVRLHEHAILAIRDGKILLHLEGGTRRRGLWKLPLRDAASLTENLAPLLLTSAYTITHHRVTLSVYECRSAEAGPDESWHPLTNLPDLPMPSPFRRVLHQILPR